MHSPINEKTEMSRWLNSTETTNELSITLHLQSEIYFVLFSIAVNARCYIPISSILYYLELNSGNEHYQACSQIAEAGF